ncbi:MAG TPA: WYL domain-containing protein [Stellaceae bacterium]|nr:WYL domain-containing protein [Stellaceae bacterium]
MRRLRDPKLQKAAEGVLEKLAAVVPQALQLQLKDAPYYVSDGSAPAVAGVDLSELRGAIHAARKMWIAYVDERDRQTHRVIWPLGLAYYVDVTLIGAWCELRGDFRHFRTDRVLASRLLDERYPADNGRIAAEWLALRKDRSDPV